MKQKILFLHHVSTIGGGSYCLLAILREIDRTKFEPVVLLKGNGPLVEEICKLGIKVIIFQKMSTIPYNRSLWKRGAIAQYLRVANSMASFRKLLIEHNIDIVYLNNMMLYPYLKIAKKYGCGTIMHVREHWPKDEHKKQMALARRYAKLYADGLIAINSFSASMFPECENKTTIVYDWIDFTDRNEPFPFDDVFGSGSSKLKVMVFTGGTANIKGALEVINNFSKCVKDENFRLLIMGAKPEYNFSGFLGLIKRILMLSGWKPYGYKVFQAINNDDRICCMPNTYKIVDIFRQAYCTLSYFTIPHANLALAEAVALGTIAIAANTPEALEYSDRGEGAVLFKFGDQLDFAKKIHYVQENYAEIRKEVAKHSIAVQICFAKEKNAAELNKAINQYTLCQYSKTKRS